MGVPARPSRAKNLTYASVAGFAGCLITGTILLSLVAGLWLDAHFKLRGPFTVGLVILSAPASLYVVFRIVLALVHHIQAPSKKDQPEADAATTGGFLEE